jgi:hypothetical protein
MQTETMTLPETVSIPEQNLFRLQEAIAKLQRRAETRKVLVYRFHAENVRPVALEASVRIVLSHIHRYGGKVIAAQLVIEIDRIRNRFEVTAYYEGDIPPINRQRVESYMNPKSWGQSWSTEELRNQRRPV